MLRKIIEGSVQHRILAILITLIIAAIGVFSFMKTPIEAFPDVTNLQVNVIAQAPGLAPEEMELQVTVPLERALNGIPGATLMRSESLFGLSMIWIVFDDHADGFKSRTYVMERLLEVDLPDNVNVELAPDYTPLGKILYYRLHADHLTPTDLRTLQETTIERSLRQVQGVADVISVGGYLKEVHVEIIPELLHGHGLSLLDVIERLERSNRNAGGGFMIHGDQEFVIRSIGRIEDAEDIRSVVLHVDKGATVTVGDVANVYQSYTPRRGVVSADYDDEIVQGIVLMRRGENPNVLLDKLRERIDSLNARGLPEGVELEILYDRGEMVARTLNTVYSNLFHGAVLVIAVCWLFLRILRGSMIVAVVIPLSLVTAFIGLYQLGLPANLISMGAIDFGIIVDGAVVLIENVQKQLRLRRPKDRASLAKVVSAATLEVARPTFFAMSIIIAAMLPIFSLESVEGRIFRPLALTYVFAMIGALIASLTIVPALAAVLLKPSDAEIEDFGFVLWLQARYASALRWVSTRRWLLAIALLLLSVATVIQTSRLGSEFLPELDEGDIYIFAEAPPSISLQSAAERFSEVRNTLMSFPEVMHVLSEQGRPEDGTDNEGVNLTKLFVRLHPTEEWTTGRSKAELVDAMRAVLTQFPGIAFNFSQPIKDSVEEAVSGVRGQVVLKVQGRDFTQMRELLLKSVDVLAEIEGVTDLGLYRDTIVPQLQVQLDRGALARHGILVEDAQTVVATTLTGTVATSFFEEEFQVPIRVRTPLADREDEAAVGNILVPAPNGMFVPLRELADLGMSNGRSTIPREQNVRYLALKFNIEGRDTGSVIAEAMEAVDAQIEVPSGLTLQWGGEFENQRRAMARLQVVVPIALLIVLLLLIAAMRSIPIASIVMLVLPFCLAGGMFGLGIVNEELSVSAAIGFIALIGQTSLLGLIMLSHLTDDPRTAPGRGSRAMVPQVAAEKLRALMMAALLTSLGLAPMAVSTAMGSETQRPFAVVIVFGMMTTLSVTLFIMPLLYSAWVFRKDGASKASSATPSAAVLAMMLAAFALQLSPAVLSPAVASSHPAQVFEGRGEAEGEGPQARADQPAGEHPNTEDALRDQLAQTDAAPHAAIKTIAFDQLLERLDGHELWQAQAEANIVAAAASKSIARAFEDPTLSYEIAGHLRGEDFVDGSQHSFLVEWEAPLRRLRAERTKVVEAEVELARAELAHARYALRQLILEAWGHVEVELHRAQVLQRAIERLEELQTVIEARVARGVTPRFDAASVRTRLLQLREELFRSLDMVVVNSLFTAEMIGQHDTLLLPAQAWTPPSLETIDALLQERRDPMLLSAQAEVSLAEAEARLARRERTPTLGLSGGVQVATHQPGRAALGGVNVRLPLFGAGRATVRKADAELHAAALRGEWATQHSASERDAQRRRWATRLRALERHDTEIVPHIEDLESLAHRSYLGGVIGFAELNDTIEHSIDVHLERVELFEALIGAYLELQRWTGR